MPWCKNCFTEMSLCIHYERINIEENKLWLWIHWFQQWLSYLRYQILDVSVIWLILQDFMLYRFFMILHKKWGKGTWRSPLCCAIALYLCWKILWRKYRHCSQKWNGVLFYCQISRLICVMTVFKLRYHMVCRSYKWFFSSTVTLRTWGSSATLWHVLTQTATSGNWALVGSHHSSRQSHVSFMFHWV